MPPLVGDNVIAIRWCFDRAGTATFYAARRQNGFAGRADRIQKCAETISKRRPYVANLILTPGHYTLNSVTGLLSGMGLSFTGVETNGVMTFSYDTVNFQTDSVVAIQGSVPVAFVATGNINVSGSIHSDGTGFAGGSPPAPGGGGGNGAGPGGGKWGGELNCGGGGGYGGAGGNGTGGAGGAPYFNIYQPLQNGSGGGASGTYPGANAGGGSGGGAIAFKAAGQVTIDGLVTVVGATGGQSASGGGGGSGGSLVISGQFVDIKASSINASGGAGGSGAYGGPGGGGGVVYVITPNTEFSIPMLNAAGGPGGTGATPGAYGKNGLVLVQIL
jgi:hypothetical protein